MKRKQGNPNPIKINLPKQSTVEEKLKQMSGTSVCSTNGKAEEKLVWENWKL